MHRSKQVELSLYTLFLSGLVLWDVLGSPWGLARWMLPTHIILGFVLMPLVVLPFLISHRRLFKFSKKPIKRYTGRALEAVFYILGLSGFYLFLMGNPGNWMGLTVYWMHLILSFPLIGIMVWHVGKRGMVRLGWVQPVRVFASEKQLAYGRT